MNASYLFKNGFDILLICLYHSFYNPILSLYIFLKAFSINYYYNFCHLYPQPSLYRWKHIIRLTDTGHIANFLFYFYPNMLPLCHNVHFMIGFGYYYTTHYLGMTSTDHIKNNPDICEVLHTIHGHMTHTLPYLILLYTNTQQKHIFDQHTFFQTITWVYCWLLFVYFPWRYYTGDPVYSILSNNTSNYTKVFVFVLFHGVIFASNELGKLLQQSNQNTIYASFK